MNGCAVVGCARPPAHRGWCKSHYMNWWRRGDPEAVGAPATLMERFWAKVERDPSGCWLWTASLADGGYGHFGRWKAHRYAYETLVEPVPHGLDLDHLCRVRHCVNPSHLEPVTRAENLRRGTHKLSLAQRQEIARSPMDAAFLAEEYGVTRSRIYQIRKAA